MSKCCWGHEDCLIPRTEKAVKEFTHTHDGETCAPHCYGCFIQNEALADARAVHDSLVDVDKFANATSDAIQKRLDAALLQIDVLRKTAQKKLDHDRSEHFGGRCLECFSVDEKMEKALKGEVQKSECQDDCPCRIGGECEVVEKVVPANNCNCLSTTRGFHHGGCPEKPVGEPPLETCAACAGTGEVHKESVDECHECGGYGSKVTEKRECEHDWIDLEDSAHVIRNKCRKCGLVEL